MPNERRAVAGLHPTARRRSSRRRAAARVPARVRLDRVEVSEHDILRGPRCDKRRQALTARLDGCSMARRAATGGYSVGGASLLNPVA
jgi:hypothetical protein